MNKAFITMRHHIQLMDGSSAAQHAMEKIERAKTFKGLAAQHSTAADKRIKSKTSEQTLLL
jgi:hypothetical protein